MSLVAALSSDIARTVIPTSWLRAARLDNRRGQEARLACEVLIECQYKRGRRTVGRYSVWLDRGQCLVRYEQLRDAMNVTKRRTARRALARVCAEMGWEFEPVTTLHPISNEYPPWHHKGGDKGHPSGHHKGAHVGTLITVENYDTLTRFGHHKGGDKGHHEGPPEGTTPSTPPGTTSHAGDPIQDTSMQDSTEYPLSSSAKPKPDVEVREVFDHWKDALGHPKAKLSPDRRSKIAARLRDGYTVDDLKRAIDGCKASPHHMGENDRGKRYDGIKLIFRGGDDVERFQGYLDTKPRKPTSTPDVYRNATIDPALQARIDRQRKELEEANR